MWHLFKNRCFQILKSTEAASEGILQEKVFLEILYAEAYNFIKTETLAHMLPCEFSEISKNNFFTEHLRTPLGDWF